MHTSQSLMLRFLCHQLLADYAVLTPKGANHAIKPPWCMVFAHWHEYDGCIVWLVPLLELCSCGDISIWNCIVKSFFSSQGHVSELAWKISSLHFFFPSVINERGVMKITIFFIASRYPWKKKSTAGSFSVRWKCTLHFISMWPECYGGQSFLFKVEI